jgi:hypothetical protein
MERNVIYGEKRHLCSSVIYARPQNRSVVPGPAEGRSPEPIIPSLSDQITARAYGFRAPERVSFGPSLRPRNDVPRLGERRHLCHLCGKRHLWRGLGARRAQAGGTRWPAGRTVINARESVIYDIYGENVIYARAAANAAKPCSRSAMRSSTSSSPICSRMVGPPGAQVVAVRALVQSNGVARLSKPPQDAPMPNRVSALRNACTAACGAGLSTTENSPDAPLKSRCQMAWPGSPAAPDPARAAPPRAARASARR